MEEQNRLELQTENGGGRTMKPLYEINEAFQNWLLKVEDNEGEVTEELMTEFENISCDFEVKAEAYAV